ncbi:hypothetical protein [Sodaliphilus sp.]|uniref:hypothetical protein n=1 Tax=Sodaliphilus sp. TaxID=2815818 RepID=UPI00388FA1A8
MKHLRFILILGVLVALAACGGDKNVQSIVSASNDEVVVMAQNAATVIAQCDHNDTLAIQTAVVDARAQRSALAIAGKREAAEAYDKALHDKLMELDPQVCNLIFANHQIPE